jgi:cytoskeletal protein CcmA (bactofilin family)
MARTVIGPETRVAGALHAKEELLVEGVVDGPVTGEGLVTIAAGSTVNGEVRGREVVIAGALAHSVHGSVAVRLTATAELRGDIHAPRFAVDEGALFEGQVRMGRAAAPAERRAPDSPMRAPAPAPAPATPAVREIPLLPTLGRRAAVRRKS